MSIASRRHTELIGITLVVTVAVLALALPAAAAVRQAVMQRLPLVVLVLGAIAGVWQLVAGIVSAVAHGRIGEKSSVSLLLGASAISMALAFLPASVHAAPRLLPLTGSALFAGLAALASYRQRARSQR